MTVTVRLDDETEARVRRLIEVRGGTLSAFVRAAIVERLDRESPEPVEKREREATKPTPDELGKHLFGRYSSGIGDLAANHE